MKYDCKSTISSNNPLSIPIDKMSSSTYSDESDSIKAIIDAETKQIDDKINKMVSAIRPDETILLDHLGDYTEEPYNLIESYFDGKHLERLVRHQLESYNNFVNYQIQKTIQMFNPVIVRSENDYNESKDKYFLEVFINFTNFKLYPPQIHENNGATKTMLPQEAKIRNFTYASTMTVDINIKYVIRNTENMDTPKTVEKTIPKINIGKLPIMLKSSICVLTKILILVINNQENVLWIVEVTLLLKVQKKPY